MTRAVHKPIVNDEGAITMKSVVQTPKDDPGLDPFAPILIKDVDVKDIEGEKTIIYNYSNTQSHPLADCLYGQASMMASVQNKNSPITEVDPDVLKELTMDMQYRSDKLIFEVMECEVLDVFYRAFSAYLTALDLYLKPITTDARCGNLIKVLYGFRPIQNVLRHGITFVRCMNMSPDQKSVYFFNQVGLAFESDSYNYLWRLVYDHVYTNLLLGNYDFDDDADNVISTVVDTFNCTFMQIREMIRPSFSAFGYRSMVMDADVINGTAEQKVAKKKQKYFPKI